MWCEGGPTPQALPAAIAVPWSQVAAALGMPPILTYATYNLYNWRRLDPAAPIQLGNIVCLQVRGGVCARWAGGAHADDGGCKCLGIRCLTHALV